MIKALITDVTGQDGSFLAEFLLDKGYEVHGVLRRSASFNMDRIKHLYAGDREREQRGKRNLQLHYGDMTDTTSLIRILREVKPDEVYNLADQSQVKFSFEMPQNTDNNNALGALRLLETVRFLGMDSHTRLYQASTSEVFGKTCEMPLLETTPSLAKNPNGVDKLNGYLTVRDYREAHGLFAVNGILFNHESERRGETIVTRKITLAAARIRYGLQERLYLKNLHAQRDWGYAGDYVESMWMMLQQSKPDDYVIATGEMHSVREFCTLAFLEAGIQLDWIGQGVDEKGVERSSGRILVEVNPAMYRPTEAEQFVGDSSKAQRVLGWNPKQTDFPSLVRRMEHADLELAAAARGENQHAFTVLNPFVF